MKNPTDNTIVFRLQKSNGAPLAITPSSTFDGKYAGFNELGVQQYYSPLFIAQQTVQSDCYAVHKNLCLYIEQNTTAYLREQYWYFD